MNRNLRMAYHEAGHVIVGDELGYTFERVELGWQGDNEALSTLATLSADRIAAIGEGNYERGKARLNEIEGTIAMAGFAAVARATGDMDLAVEGAAVDREIAVRAVRRANARGERTVDLQYFHDRAAEILRRRWGHVEIIAAKLVQDGAITKNDIAVLLAHAPETLGA